MPLLFVPSNLKPLIFNVVFGEEERICALHQFLIPEVTTTFDHLNIQFLFPEYVKKYSLPYYPDLANQSTETLIPREMVISFLRPNYNLTIGFNVHQPTNVTSLVVKTVHQLQYNHSCTFNSSVLGDAFFISNCSFSDGYFIDISLLLEMNKQNSSLFVNHIEHYTNWIINKLIFWHNFLKNRLPDVKGFENIRDESFYNFHCPMFDKLKFYREQVITKFWVILLIFIIFVIFSAFGFYFKSKICNRSTK